jgi:Sec-independent protein translocase protein TatA
MYLSVGQIILLAIVFFLFFGNFNKLNQLFINLKSNLNKNTKKKNDNLEE